MQKYIAMRPFGAPDWIRTSGLWSRRTTTEQCGSTLNREFCWFCTVASKTRKRLLVVVTIGFSGILWYDCTVVVKWWSKLSHSMQRYIERMILETKVTHAFLYKLHYARSLTTLQEHTISINYAPALPFISSEEI